jgi:hypothetical protein
MPEIMPQHVSIVFKELFAELQAFKRQQWTITNYAILILKRFPIIWKYIRHG